MERGRQVLSASAFRHSVLVTDVFCCRMNLGRPRVHPGQEVTGIKVHRSVKTRMQAKHLNYTPRLKFDVEPEWVD